MGKGAGDSMLMRGIRLEGDGRRLTGDLYDTDMVLAVDTDQDGDFLEYVIRMRSGAVKSGQITAAGLDVREAHYDFSFNHLHVDTLQKLMATMKAGYAKAVETGTAPDFMPEPLRVHVMELLRHDPRFVIDRFGIVTPEGEAVVKGTIRLEHVAGEELAADAASPGGAIVADLRVEVPRWPVRHARGRQTGKPYRIWQRRVEGQWQGPARAAAWCAGR